MYWPNQRWSDQLKQQMRETVTLFVVNILKQSDYFALFQVTEMSAKQ
jgi:hypothetical protein